MVTEVLSRGAVGAARASIGRGSHSRRGPRSPDQARFGRLPQIAAVSGVRPTAAVANRSDRFFQSGYVEGAWVINGNGRPYRIAPTYGSEFAVLTGVEIDDAQRISRGGFGVFEVAARYSAIDLQDRTTLGGRQQDVTAGLNWYPDRNIRVMADDVHSTVDPAAASLKVDKVDSDAFVGRLQFAW